METTEVGPSSTSAIKCFATIATCVCVCVPLSARVAPFKDELCCRALILFFFALPDGGESIGGHPAGSHKRASKRAS